MPRIQSLLEKGSFTHEYFHGVSFFSLLRTFSAEHQRAQQRRRCTAWIDNPVMPTMFE